MGVGPRKVHRASCLLSHHHADPLLSSPLIFNGADPNPVTQPVQGTGHSDLIELADGSWWGVCLGVRPQGGNFNRAQLDTRIRTVT